MTRDIFREAQGRVAARALAIEAISAKGPRPLLAPDRHGGTVHLISPDPCKPGGWRSTRYDDRGAAGDTRCDGSDAFVAILRAASDHGADLAQAREVTAENVAAIAEALGIVVGVDEERPAATAYLAWIISGCVGDAPMTEERQWAEEHPGVKWG